MPRKWLLRTKMFAYRPYRGNVYAAPAAATAAAEETNDQQQYIYVYMIKIN